MSTSSEEIAKQLISHAATAVVTPLRRVVGGAAVEVEAIAAVSPPKPASQSMAVVGGAGASAIAPATAPTIDITSLNDQHAVIDNVGGRTVIASWEISKLDPSRTEVVYQQPSHFLLRYSNRTVAVNVPGRRGGVNTEMVELGKWWLRHPERRQYRGVVFSPGEPKVIDGCLNLWQGWGVLAVEGDWSLIRQHIFEVIAGGNAEFADYVIRWIAWAIQNPAKQAEVALVLIGQKGAGKGTLVRCLQRIFGAHAFQAQSSEHVIGRFNGHLQDCVLFVPDEAYWSDGADYKKCVGRLQGMITEPTLAVELKGIDLFQVRNCLHVMMLAEPGWVIPAGRHERRYAALSVSNRKLRDKSYFTALHRQIDAGGAEAMFYDLQDLDLDGWHPRDLPEALLRSEALQRQQMRSLPPEEGWYYGLLLDGRLPEPFPKRPNASLTRDLIKDAREKFPSLKYNMSVRSLQIFLEDIDRIGVCCANARTAPANGWAFPPLAECRAAWERLYGPMGWNLEDEWKGAASAVPAAKQIVAKHTQALAAPAAVAVVAASPPLAHRVNRRGL